METQKEPPYIPQKGLGPILLPLLSTLPIRIEFEREDNQEAARFKLFNLSEQSLFFEDKYAENGASCVFSAFFSDHSIIGIDKYTKIQFRPRKFTESLTMHCKVDPKDNKMIITDQDDLNAKETTFVPVIKSEILVDPFTETIISGCSIAFVPKPDSQYSISHIRVLEEFSEVDHVISVENRKNCLKRVAEILEKKKLDVAKEKELEEEEKKKEKKRETLMKDLIEKAREETRQKTSNSNTTPKEKKMGTD